MIRIGNGIDFHKLSIDDKRPLLLGGFILPSDYVLIGHSDADIVLHALADAILGALALGDIGYYFPDTDPSLKNMDSKRIMEKTLELMNERQYCICNVDITVICEVPRIAKYRDDIRLSLAKILGVSVDQVSVKGTTTEKMGALGRKEGVGVLCTVLLEK
jgi:2-C-methyl-D-erythritol 2,4-cyclodiphosphate synthase